jgi:hypothetical protein
MGVYFKLISRHLRIDLDNLLKSAIGDEISVAPDAASIFVDTGCVEGSNRSRNWAVQRKTAFEKKQV